MITSNRTKNSAQPGVLRICAIFLLSFFLLTVGCGGGGGGDSSQAGVPSLSFATVIANSEANKSSPVSSPPTFQLDEVVQAIKNANLTTPEKVYKVAVAAELSVAQVDALFELPAGTAAAYIASRALPQPKGTATILGLQLSRQPVSLTQVRQLVAGVDLTDMGKMYSFGQMENLSSVDLNQVTGSPPGTFENFIAGNGANPLPNANRITTLDADNTLVEVKDIPGLMLKKGWPTAAAFMSRWFAGTGGIHPVTFESVENLYGPLNSEIERTGWKTLFGETVGGESPSHSPYEPYLLAELRKLVNQNGSKPLLHGGNFDFIESELRLASQTDNLKIGDRSEEKKLHYIGTHAIENTGLNEFTAAYGRVTLRLLANGQVNVDSNGLAKITVTEIGVYAYDSYDFTSNIILGFDTNQWLGLGCWSKSIPYVYAASLDASVKCFNNVDFENYNSSLSVLSGWKKGVNYRIFSSVKRIPLSAQSFYYQLTNTEMADRNALLTSAPSVPSLGLVSKTANSVSLQWTNPVGATYYVLNRSGTDSNIPNSSSFVDNGVSPNTAYTYTIKACNITGCSGASAVLSVTTDAATSTTPSNPTSTITLTNQPPVVNSASAVQNADGSLTLNFAATDPEGSTVGADVYISNLGGSTFNAASRKIVAPGASGGARSVSWSKAEADGFMVAGQTYAVRVDAFDTAGAKGQLATSSFIRNAAANQPPIVNSASAVQNADGSLTLNFAATDPEGSTVGADAYISNLGGSTFNAASRKIVAPGASGSARSVSWTKAEADSFMVAGQTYAVRVDGFDTAGAKGQLASSSFVRNAVANRAPVVSSFSINNTANSTVAGSFLISDADGDGIAKLRVHVGTSPGVSQCLIDVGGVFGTLQATGSKSFSGNCPSIMTYSGTYYAKVEAWDSQGEQAAVVYTTFIYTPIVANRAPVVSGFSINNTANSTVAGSFAISDADGDSIAKLRVHVGTSPGASQCLIDVGGVFGAVQATGSKSFSGNCPSIMTYSGTYYAKVEAWDSQSAQAIVVSTSFTYTPVLFNRAPVVSNFSVNNTTNGTVAGSFSINDPDGDSVTRLRVHVGNIFGASQCVIDVGGVYGSVQSAGSKSFSGNCASIMNFSGTYHAKVEAWDSQNSQAAVVYTTFIRQ